MLFFLAIYRSKLQSYINNSNSYFMKNFRSKMLSATEAREIQGTGRCLYPTRNTSVVEAGRIPAGTCFDAQAACLDPMIVGPSDELVNYEYYRSNGDWRARCYVKFNYWGFGF